MKYEFSGLDDQGVQQNRAKYGTNQLSPQKSESFWDKLKGNFQDPIILILVVALAINVTLALLGYAKWYEGVGIAIAVLLATMVATLSEHKNESTFQKLQEEASQINCKVFRSGSIKEINIDSVVVGDYVLLQCGDKVPADGTIVSGTLEVVQAALTGEAEGIKKTAPAGGHNATADDLQSPHAVFRGTVVSDGEAVFKVQTVGDNTFLGKLAGELASDDRESPLKVKLSKLAVAISKFGYIGSTFIALSFMFKKIAIDNSFVASAMLSYITNWPVFLHDLVTAVILAIIIVVVAVPEGLPMMIALVLSLNMRKLLSDRVLVRKLIGIETSGSLNILFTDKTGTITRGELEAVLYLSGNCKTYSSFREIPRNLRNMLALSVIKNNGCFIGKEGGKEQYVGGNSTERATLKFIDLELAENTNSRVVNKIPFNSERKFSATQIEGDVKITLVKGAPEIVLEQCQYCYDENGEKVGLSEKEGLVRAIEQLAGRAIRVIAVATSEEPLSGTQMPQELTLVGVIGIRDNIRAESVPAIREAQQAGIQVVMITGDRRETAVSIAREAGLLKKPDELVLSSAEMKIMSDEKLKEMLPRIRVVERALPTDKSRLVRLAQEMGMVVGMTGDGVNDAPALKKADVGFAMGSGTEVAKEAGDIVILDDNFSSIARAILYGRTIFNSIRKFIVFQLTVNVSAILIAFIGPFLGYDLPLTMIQLLWINLVMDTLAALAFGGEAALRKYMAEKPKRREESIISTDMWSSILINGSAIAMLSIIFLMYPPVKGFFHSEAAFMTGFFAFFVFLNNFNKFNARTDGINLFAHILENKGFLKVVGLIFIVQVTFTYLGGDVLRTVGLTGSEWLFILAFSFLIIPIDLARKTIRDLRVGVNYRVSELRRTAMEQAATKDK